MLRNHWENKDFRKVQDYTKHEEVVYSNKDVYTGQRRCTNDMYVVSADGTPWI